MGREIKGLADLVRYLTSDIWVEDFTSEGRRTRGLVSVVRWCYLVVYGFLRDRCLLRAAALSYTTTLSIAPFLAVAFSISKGFGVQNTEFIRDLLLKATAGRTELVDQILAYVDQTSMKTLGFIGLGILLFSVVSLLGTIEKSFNSIWGVTRGRSPWRKFTDFFSVTLISPVFLLVGVSLGVSLESDAVVQKILQVTAFNYLYVFLIQFAPFVSVTLALTFLYAFMPNTKVKTTSALCGGAAASLLWQYAQWGYVNYQVGVSKYNAIYGSFAQFPLFLVWLYISWMIVLLGAEISFAAQNLRTFRGEVRARHASPEDRQRIAVLALLLLTRNFEEGAGCVSNDHLATELEVPVKIINDIFKILAQRNIVARLEGEEADIYTLVRDPSKVTITDVVNALNRSEDGMSFVTLKYGFVREMFSDIYGAAEASPANLSLRDYYERLCEEGAAACFERS